MITTRDRPPSGPKILAVNFLSHGVLVAFADGKEYIYRTVELYALIPADFDMEKQVQDLIG
jgi:hypothetical protein